MVFSEDLFGVDLFFRFTMASRCRIRFLLHLINLLFVPEYELGEDRLLIPIVLLRGYDLFSCLVLEKVKLVMMNESHWHSSDALENLNATLSFIIYRGEEVASQKLMLSGY